MSPLYELLKFELCTLERVKIRIVYSLILKNFKGQGYKLLLETLLVTYVIYNTYTRKYQATIKLYIINILILREIVIQGDPFNVKAFLCQNKNS